MITKTDVEQTVLAADPASTPQDIESLWQTVSETMSSRTQELYATMKQKYQQAHGRIPDSLSDEKIRDRAYMDAENSVRGQYLEPLTAQLVDDELEMQAQQEELSLDLLLQDPHAWRGEDWIDLPAPPWTDELSETLWAEESTRFRITAARRIYLAYYQGQPYPKTPGELAEQWRIQILDSVQAKAQEMQELQNRR